MLSRFQHKFVAAVVASWLALTIIAVGIQLRERGQLARNVAASSQAAQLDESLQTLFSAIQDAETGQRGYLLTGNDSYLPPFDRAESTLPGMFDDLAPMVASNIPLQDDLLELKGVTEVKLTEMRNSIAIRRQKNLAAAMEVVNSNQGKEAMDHVRDLIGRMRLRLLPVMAESMEATRRDLARAQSLDAATGLLGAGAGVLALYLLWILYLKEKSRREMSEEKLRTERAMVAKSAFLANISHEIRTPMNAILGFGELLEDEKLTHRQAQFVRCIRQSGKALLQLINDVLDLSKLEAGKLEVRLEPTDVRELCNFLQIMFAQQAAAKSIRLQWDTGDVPGALLLDRLRLRQVLMNLVGNAVKFTDRGHVQFHAEWIRENEDRGLGTLYFHVEDTGIGISPEKQEEIFKPFVQSGSSRTAGTEGTGLGLHLVQRLTDIMGGTVTLESTPGRGSVFHLRFPHVPISARLPVNDEAEVSENVDFNDLAAATLLMVDDNETNRMLVASIFEGTHHIIRHAGNGKEALASIAEMKPGVVLLDIRMPGMDGRQTLAEIRKIRGLEFLPVIAVSASDPQADEPDLRRRFNGYIRKPFTRQTLYKELALFLPRRTDRGVLRRASDAGGAIAAELLPDSAAAGDWEALVADLRALQGSEWAGLQESLAINETQAFAQKLLSRAQAAHCGPLAAYAQALAQGAETYSIHDLEGLIAEFPDLIDRLGQHQTAGSHE
jgi:signal transduction histidine kinase/DNA-binding response OmpR family regulator